MYPHPKEAELSTLGQTLLDYLAWGTRGICKQVRHRLLLIQTNGGQLRITFPEFRAGGSWQRNPCGTAEKFQQG